MGGRPVYGGGGIAPDETVANDTLPPLARRVEERTLAFRFANRWVNGHAGARPDAAALWPAFAAFLEEEKIGDGSAIARERGRIESALARELARRTGGDSAAVRVILSGDRVYRRAVEVLGRAHKPADVFTSVPAAGDERLGAAPGVRAPRTPVASRR
jgi:hypothetical protein